MNSSSGAVDQADRANAAKTSFLSHMSHDIRTPLNGILGLLQIDAAHPDDTALLSANREKMRVAADHLLALINDILEMSQLESGEIVLAREPLDLETLTSDVFTIIEQRAAESGITMVRDERSDPMELPYVYGSPLHLRQILLNIYTNCIKYNRVGGRITTRFQCLGRKNQVVTYRWTISDTGIGMSEAFLEHIFDPFSQENVADRKGTGLGMTIVQNLVEKMHGTIEISSTEGVGSTFVITLPFAVSEQAVAAPPPPGPHGQSPGPAPAAGRRQRAQHRDRAHLPLRRGGHAHHRQRRAGGRRGLPDPPGGHLRCHPHGHYDAGDGRPHRHEDHSGHGPAGRQDHPHPGHDGQRL